MECNKEVMQEKLSNARKVIDDESWIDPSAASVAINLVEVAQFLLDNVDFKDQSHLQ